MNFFSHSQLQHKLYVNFIYYYYVTLPINSYAEVVIVTNYFPMENGQLGFVKWAAGVANF